MMGKRRPLRRCVLLTLLGLRGGLDLVLGQGVGQGRSGGEQDGEEDGLDGSHVDGLLWFS